MRLKPILMASVTTLALSGLSLTGAQAAQQTQQNRATSQNQQQATKQNAQNGKIDLVTWSQEDLYKGWTAEQMMDQPVYGENGEQAGTVENFLIGPKGQIESLLLDNPGGFLGIGDATYAVPWKQVQIGQNMRMTVPVTRDNIDQYSVFQPEQENAAGNRAFRASELIGDFVSLQDVPQYGIVRDLVFNNQGQMQAVVISPDVGYGVGGPYAYPYYGYGYGGGWNPGNNYYNLPYNQSEISQLGPFDYSKLPYGPPSQQTAQQQNQ